MAESDDDGFLSRWSRRKRAGAPDPRAQDVAIAPAAPDAAAPAPERAKAEAPAVPENLPDPDSLTLDSDFTVFLQDGVPEVLRRRALRRLWRLNPVFANLDGLNDYDEDYTDAALVVKGLKTAYKVGRGFLTDDEETPADAPQPAPSADERRVPDAAGCADPTPAEAAASRGASEHAALGGRDQDADRPAAAAQAAARPRHDVAARPEAPRRRGARQRRWGSPSD